MNDKKHIALSHGHCLTSWIRGRDDSGADALALNWYDRNLRICRRIQRLVSGPNERVVVIIGAGHLPLLRHSFEHSPEFDLVELASVLSEE